MAGPRVFNRAGELPAWARWSSAGAERPWAVGLEEEVVLLDPRDWSVANRIDDVLDALPSAIVAHASAETHACVLELNTGAHATVADAAAELAWLRRSVESTLRDRLGLRAAVAGTHPLATRSEVAIASGLRYQQIDASMRALARREPTMAQHVHVAVPDEAAAVRALARLRPRLGTVEVRIMDAQSGVADAAALAAVVHCLVRRHAQGDSTTGTAPELLEENRFLAARDGVQAKLIDVRTQRRRPLREAL